MFTYLCLINEIRRVHDEGSTYKEVDILLGLDVLGFRSYLLNREARRLGF